VNNKVNTSIIPNGELLSQAIVELHSVISKGEPVLATKYVHIITKLNEIDKNLIKIYKEIKER